MDVLVGVMLVVHPPSVDPITTGPTIASGTELPLRVAGPAPRENRNLVIRAVPVSLTRVSQRHVAARRHCTHADLRRLGKQLAGGGT